MTPIEQFYQYTEELVQLFEGTDRDEKIAKIEELLSKRESLMKDIKGPFSKEEKELNLKIQPLNTRLQQLMALEKATIQKDINSLKKKKETSNRYTNPYDHLNVDGVFYDKKN